MTTTSSDLALTVIPTYGGAGKEAFAHLSRDESQAMIPSLILELSGRISRRVALRRHHRVTKLKSSEDLVALAWIRGSLEDMRPPSSACRKQTAAVLQRSRIRPLLLPEAWFPRFRPGQPAASIKAPVDHAGRLPLLPSTPRASGVSTVLITALRVRIHDHARSTRMSPHRRSHPKGTGCSPG